MSREVSRLIGVSIQNNFLGNPMNYYLIAAVAGLAVGVVTLSPKKAFINSGLFLLLAWLPVPTFAGGYYPAIVLLTLVPGSAWAWAALSDNVSDRTKTFWGFYGLVVTLLTFIVLPMLVNEEIKGEKITVEPCVQPSKAVNECKDPVGAGAVLDRYSQPL